MDPNQIPWYIWLLAGAGGWQLIFSFVLPDDFAAKLAMRKNTPYALIPHVVIGILIWGSSIYKIVRRAIAFILDDAEFAPWMSPLFWGIVVVVFLSVATYIIRRGRNQKPKEA